MEIKLLSCPVCNSAQYQDVFILRNALVDVTKKSLQCPICKEILTGLDKFTIHLFTHAHIIINDDHQQQEVNNNDNKNEEKEAMGTIICDACNFECIDANILEMHKNLLHMPAFSCELCEKKFKMHGSLMVHMRVAHYGFQNKSDDATTAVPNPEEEEKTQTTQNEFVMKTSENKQWKCDVCLKKFTTKYFLKKHKRLHTGEMPYECTLCNKAFTFQQSYHKHMLYHSADKPHSCTECGRAFKELSTLHNHQRIHSGERPFGCETCGKRFRQRVSYLVHRRIHTGAMPYKCTSCDKSFRYKVSQRTHKCKTQPPGSVVRQFGDLVQKILQNRTQEETTPSNPPEIVNNEKHDPPPDFFGLVMSPTFQIASDQFESLCLNNENNETNENNNNNNNGQNMFDPLINNETNSYQIRINECSTINEECFKELLYNNP